MVITVDLPTGGKRERDARNRFVQPFRPRFMQVLEAMTKPDWSWRILANGGLPQLENLRGLTRRSDESMATLASSVGQQLDASFDERGFARMREMWKGRLVVKGVVRPDDAERIVALGADAIWVSNHGGRQLDGAPATLDALEPVVRAVGARVPVMVDGGVRRGSDLVKARAMGAQCACAGRPTLYGVSAGGQAGAQRALAILADELVRTLQLTGARSLAEVSRDLVTP